MATNELVSEIKKVNLLPEIDVAAKYTYALAQKNDARGRVYNAEGIPLKDPEYPPRRNLLLRSSIIWTKDTPDPFNEKKFRAAGKHLIRYYDGCTTLFVDDQPKEKDIIEQLVASTRELHFINGYLSIYGYESMLKTYMDWASYNAESKLRVPTIDPIYLLLDSEKQGKAQAEHLDNVEKALEYARKAEDKHMLIHSLFLNIPQVDEITGNPLSPEAIRAKYRREAMENPDNFIATYQDKTLHFRHWILKSLDSGVISTTVVPNKAVWKDKGSVICDVSGIVSKEGILNKLIEFSQTKEGGSFADQLKAINN